MPWTGGQKRVSPEHGCRGVWAAKGLLWWGQSASLQAPSAPAMTASLGMD